MPPLSHGLASLLLIPGLLSDGQTAPSAGQQPLYQVAHDVSPPHLLTEVDPVPPDLETAEHAAGICRVSFIVNSSGQPEQIVIERGISASMDPAILAAVRQYRFQPALLHGRPVPVRAVLSIRVNLPPIRHTGLIAR